MKLTELHVADPPGRWEALGFEVRDATCELGGIAVRLGGDGEGITSWAIDGIDETDIDGLRTAPAGAPSMPQSHPNGATGIDHIVILTPDFGRTTKALADLGIPLRRIRETDSLHQGFRRLGPAILELVEAPGEGPARFWGLVVVVSDLDVLAARLGDQLGKIRDAVQPGRRIATLRQSAGLGEAVAFMTP